MTANNENYNVRMPKMPGEHKTWTFTLSMPGLITACGSALVALTLFFILGLLVGRGYQPEKNIPQLAAHMPGTSTEPETKVLKAEELTYPETLAKQPKGPVKEEEAAEQKKEKQAADKKASTAEAPKAAAKKAEAEKAKTLKAGEKVYDYAYQAASFRKEEMAVSLRDKLVAAGLNVSIESAETGKGSWFRVLVNHRGTPESTNQMKAVLSRFGIERPLMKRKKLVGTAQ